MKNDYGKCEIKDCAKPRQHRSGKYCVMHLGRVRRHGYPELKKDAYQSLEKLPHGIVDEFILKNCGEMIDEEITKNLRSMGYKDANKWNIGYRRRKLNRRKYLRGEIQKHKAWVRSQAIKKYGKACELCGYNATVDTHHILPKYRGGPHEIENLTVICPNCHALITRGKLILNTRNDIPDVRKKISHQLKKFYNFL